MEPIQLQHTNKTPRVLFDAASGLLEFHGRSIPENTAEFYKPLMDWMRAYIRNPNPKTVVNVHLEYFHSGTAKYLLRLLELLNPLSDKGADVIINWVCDDDDALESGKDFADLLEIPFNFIRAES